MDRAERDGVAVGGLLGSLAGGTIMAARSRSCRNGLVDLHTSLIPAANVRTEPGSRASGSGGTLGGRGSRSDSAVVRRAPDRLETGLARAIAPAATPARRSRPWLSTLAGFAAGGLIADALFGGFGVDSEISLGFLGLLLGGSVIVPMLLRRLRAVQAQPRRTPGSVSSSVEALASSSRASSLDQGVRDIRRTDPGFDPARFAGYTAMLFRDAQAAWTTRDIHAVRDRVTPEMYVELQAQCARLRMIGQADRVEGIEITAEITEAWQERGRDYATAHIDGSTVDYTVDEATQSLIHGSRTIPRKIEEFWTFTRPAGLNFWMLSAVQRA